jgi:predicted acylesterase/phospholipase RssA
MLIIRDDFKPIDFDVSDVAYGIAGGALLGPFPSGVLIAHGQAGLLQKCNLIMGTSVGAAVGAVAAKDYKLLQALWEGITDSGKVWKGDLKNKFTDVWGALFCDSILDPAPFYGIVDKIFGNMTMADLAKINDIELIFPAVDNNTHQLQCFSSFGDLKNIKVADVIKSSAAIPVGLKSVKVEMADLRPHWMSDGGAGANNPLIAVHDYNKVFPDKIKKLILIFCGADNPAQDNKEYKLARDAGINQIQTMLDIQEQVSEKFAEMITSAGVMDVCAIYKPGGLGDSFTADPSRLQVGYDVGVKGMVWDYRTSAEISLIDFLKRKAI